MEVVHAYLAIPHSTVLWFYFNEPATLDIYPFCHSLTLHVALPICPRRAAGRGDGARPPHGRRPEPPGGRAADAGRGPRPRPAAAAAPAGGQDRSEEHTSELQSLMRISYAVFCLKKKKHTSHKNHRLISTNKSTSLISAPSLK